MRLSDLKPIGESVFGLEKGDSDQKQDNEGIAQLRFGGVQTAFTPKEFTEDTDV
jgi:hypothetical protein